MYIALLNIFYMNACVCFAGTIAIQDKSIMKSFIGIGSPFCIFYQLQIWIT